GRPDREREADRLRVLGLGQEGLGGRVGHPANREEVHPPGTGALHHHRRGRDRARGTLRDAGAHRAEHGDPEVLMRRRRTQRGVTLLMVTVSIAILTAVAAEFAFQTRVDLELATHQRDALRAEYLAQSSVSLARMLLLFQKQLDRTSGQLPGAAQGINLQLWRMAKLDCHLMSSVVPQAGAGRRGDFAVTGAGGAPDEGSIPYCGLVGVFG